jgi:DNA invertase Pin-like site-specific DNA recombinase
MTKYVTYKRVSTKEQGKSGLGIDAQERDMHTFLDNYSSQPFEIVGEFVEVESGSSVTREQLTLAIALAKKEKAVLLVAKLDRLSRKVSFIASLMEDKSIQFKVACLPQADNFQLHIYAALAEQEREFISQRTIAALREAKARGVKLGGLRDKTMQRNIVRQTQALDFALKLSAIVSPLREQGKTYLEIGDALNEAGISTARGGKWQPTQVKRVLERTAANSPLLKPDSTMR